MIVSRLYVVAATGSPVIMGLSAPGTCDRPRRNQNRTRPVSSPTSPARVVFARSRLLLRLLLSGPPRILFVCRDVFAPWSSFFRLAPSAVPPP
ncbi:unnamed protein product [Macrosiphum euphorbiae]|uniref:Secreted protein n=1 Tax=Macrosiphum euphorbiae TaxID=13131 RepID=A0AAV0X2B3_9HEMI|nr:unnamed protein product [Macrosiphum euphorbiae]